MIVLYILLCVLCFIFLLLLIPIRLQVTYDNEFTLKLRYLFLKFNILSEEEKPKSRKKRDKLVKKEPAKKESKIKDLIKREGYIGAFEIFKKYFFALYKDFKPLIKHIKLKPFNLKLIMASDDAANLAIEYGQFCSVFYPFVTFLRTQLKLKKYNSDIRVDYKKSEYELHFYTVIRLLPIFIVITAVKMLISFTKIKMANMTADKLSKKKGML